MNAARVAIRRVRLKSGGEVHLLRPEQDQSRAHVERQVRDCLDLTDDVAGAAFVVWCAKGGSTAAMFSGPTSTIPSILAPDFVRNRLLAMKIIGWTMDDINQCNGFPPDDAG